MPSNISKNSKTFPKVSIIIPTLNSEKIITSCLESITSQNYLNYEILVCDGGSTDKTISIAQKYHCQIINNKLKTAESGKSVGLKYVTGKYIALIDSDNILPTSNWFKQMITTMESDPLLVGCEPWEFTYRKNSGFIERYSSLLGANDPYAYIIGISDKRNAINQQWTTLKLYQRLLPKYIQVRLDPGKTLPTIGANGTVFKTDFLKSNVNHDYLFDIDVITGVLNKTKKPIYFAKVKNGIIHTYCESSITKFYKKQLRRLKDYFQFQSVRTFDYKSNAMDNNLKFVLYVVLVFPMLYTTILGYIKKPDIAWFFHPIACIITLYCYSTTTILHLLGHPITQSRKNWSQ